MSADGMQAGTMQELLGGRIAVVLVVRDEPMGRLQRAIRSLASQRGVQGLELVIAAPVNEHARLRALQAIGAVGSIALVPNPTGARSAGLNRALAACTAAFVVRVDARATLPADYVARCVGRLVDNPQIGVVGGVQWPVAERSDRAQRGIERALRNRWLLGNAAYRRPGEEGPVDTVYLGVFRRRELQALGGFDERLAANEDFDVCHRYAERGFEVWLEPEVTVAYEPRRRLLELFAQYRAFGVSKVHYWRLTGRRPNRRQRVALGVGAAAIVAAMVTTVSHPRRAALAIPGAVVAAAVVDHVGEAGERDLRVRARALLAYGAITGGWLLGVATAVASRRTIRPLR